MIIYALSDGAVAPTRLSSWQMTRAAPQGVAGEMPPLRPSRKIVWSQFWSQFVLIRRCSHLCG